MELIKVKEKKNEVIINLNNKNYIFNYENKKEEEIIYINKLLKDILLINELGKKISHFKLKKNIESIENKLETLYNKKIIIKKDMNINFNTIDI